MGQTNKQTNKKSYNENKQQKKNTPLDYIL